MTRKDFQRLTQMRVRDARILLKNGNNEGAYYFAGLAVECALKAAIARRTQRYDFPPEPKIVAQQMYVHRLDTLLTAAGLGPVLDAAVATDRVLEANWALVKDWHNESVRGQRAEGERSVRGDYWTKRSSEMATAVLVDRDLDIGRKVVQVLAAARITVSVAFWAYIPQLGEWQLFIATPLVDSKGPKLAYEQVLRALHDGGMDPQLPWRRIFLRSPKDRVLKSLENRTSYSGPVEITEMGNIPEGTSSTYYVTYAPGPGGTFKIVNEAVGERFVEDAYVYGTTWAVRGIEHLRDLLSKLRVGGSDQERAIQELAANKRTVVPNVQLRVQDFKRLRPA